MGKKLIVVLILLVLCAQVGLGADTREIFDINDRQTKELKKYIDDKVSSATEEANKFTDDLFVTFDGKMRELTKNFVIQMAVILFFATVLGNFVVMLFKQRHERKLLEYKFQILLSKETELKTRELDILNQYEKAKRDIDARIKEFTRLQTRDTPEYSGEVGFSEVVVGGEKPKPEEKEIKEVGEPLPPPPKPEESKKKGVLGKIKNKIKRKPQTDKQKADTKASDDLASALKGVK